VTREDTPNIFLMFYKADPNRVNIGDGNPGPCERQTGDPGRIIVKGNQQLKKAKRRCFAYFYRWEVKPWEVVFDSATGLAGLATKLTVSSRSWLSLTEPAKPAKPAKVFCFLLSKYIKHPKKGKICKSRFFPQKNAYHEVWTLDWM
jgi:hypothetical protein